MPEYSLIASHRPLAQASWVPGCRPAGQGRGLSSSPMLVRTHLDDGTTLILSWRKAPVGGFMPALPGGSRGRLPERRASHQVRRGGIAPAGCRGSLSALETSGAWVLGPGGNGNVPQGQAAPLALGMGSRGER